MVTILERKSQEFNTDVFDTSSLALEPSISNSGVMPELNDPINLSLNRASSTTDSTGATYNLGTLLSYPPIQRNNYSVTVGDPTDVFKFRITDTRNINLNLHNISTGDDADLRLYQDSNRNGILDANDQQIITSRNASNRDDSINYRASAGTYFAKVERYARGSVGNVYYNLHLSATPINGASSQRASNLLPIEYNLGTLNGTRTLTGWVGNTDTSDIFHFRLGSNRNVNLTLTGLNNDSDLRLIRDANGNRIVDSGDVLVSSALGSRNSEWISRSLGSGNYFVQVHQYSGNTNYYLSASTGDWYSQHLSDPGIIGLARQFARNGQLDRNEMIRILRDTKDFGSVSSTELRDLRTLVVGLPDAPRPVSMPGYVYNLSYKTVYGNRANQWWTGGGTTHQALGNLYAGASADHMEKLIGKWFLGLDRPTAVSTNSRTTNPQSITVYGYRSVSGSLFQGGISRNDVDQGDLGDCYFLAALAGTANLSTRRISNMFIDNGDNTWTVRFYNNGVADYVTVDRFLPTNTQGRAVYAAWGDRNNTNTNVNNELWVALLEKAYAQVNEENWIGQSGTNAYQEPDIPRTDGSNRTGISWGDGLASLRHTTALSTRGWWNATNSDASSVLNAFNSGRTILVAWGGHCRSIVDYNPSNRQYTIYNPWGFNEFLTWNQIVARTSSWGYAMS